jgi:hypothetical protein
MVVIKCIGFEYTDRSTSVYIFFLSPERAATYQPRATPWGTINQYLSPVRAQHKDKLKRTHSKNVTPLQGLKFFYIFPQGVALGWYVAALSGLRKKMYTLIDLSVGTKALFVRGRT